MIHTECFRKKYQHTINLRLCMGSVISLKHGRKADEMDFDVWLPTKQCNLQRPLVWDTHYSYWDDPISDVTKIAIFEQINFTGTPQDLEHLNKLKSL